MNTRFGLRILVVQHVCLGRSVLENAWHHRGVVVGGGTSRTSASSGRAGKTHAAEARPGREKTQRQPHARNLSVSWDRHSDALQRPLAAALSREVWRL